jgi:hypothetical protein
MTVISLQLSQAAASIDNRVPTPSSVTSAETSSQQPGPDVPMLEMKTEVQTDDAEPEPTESKGEPRSEVDAPSALVHSYVWQLYHISSGPNVVLDIHFNCSSFPQIFLLMFFFHF